jgi:hypothetical protein
MPKHSQSARFTKFINYTKWKGTPEEFAEKLPLYIKNIPDLDIQDSLTRYYGGGKASQITDPITGRPDPKDSRFYQLLRYGRMMIKLQVMLE